MTSLERPVKTTYLKIMNGQIILGRFQNGIDPANRNSCPL